jgi:hypothetical protein
MPFLDPKPDPFRAGQSGRLSASALNALIKNRLRQIRGGRDTDVGYFGDRVVVSSHQIGPLQVDVANFLNPFAVISETDDWLVCVPFIQPTGANGEWEPQVYDSGLDAGNPVQILVAKPYILQRSPWDGQTVTINGIAYTYSYGATGSRVAIIGTSGSVTQNITPSYFPGDIIEGIKVPTGYTDPTLNVPVVWVDANLAARKWTPPDNTSLTICSDCSDIGDVLTYIGLAPPGEVSALLIAGGSLPVGTRQFYVITAFNACGETLASQVVSANPTITNRSISLVWSIVSTAIGYKIYRSTTLTFSSPSLLVILGVVNTYTDTGAVVLQLGLPPTSSKAGLWCGQSASLIDVVTNVCLFASGIVQPWNGFSDASTIGTMTFAQLLQLLRLIVQFSRVPILPVPAPPYTNYCITDATNCCPEGSGSGGGCCPPSVLCLTYYRPGAPPTPSGVYVLTEVATGIWRSTPFQWLIDGPATYWNLSCVQENAPVNGCNCQEWELVLAFVTGGAESFDTNTRYSCPPFAVGGGPGPPGAYWQVIEGNCSGSGSGSGSGGGSCCFTGDPPATDLTAVVTNALGCFTGTFGLPASFTLGANSLAGGTYGWFSRQTFQACNSQENTLIEVLCEPSQNNLPCLVIHDGLGNIDVAIPPQPGWTCSPFCAVYHVDFGGGNSCTITVGCGSGSGSGGGCNLAFTGVSVIQSLGTVTTLSNPVTVPDNCMLVVNVGTLVGAWGNITVTWNGRTMTEGAAVSDTFISGPAWAGTFTLPISAGQGGTHNVIITVDVASVILTNASYVTGLANENVDVLGGNTGVNSAPGTGTIGPTNSACEYSPAVFLLQLPGTYSWGGSYASDGLDGSVTVSAVSYTLSSGHQLLSAVTTLDASLSGTSPANWAGCVGSYN